MKSQSPDPSSGDRPTPDAAWRESLAAGLLAGFLGGELFLGIGLLRTGSDLFVTSPAPGFAAWILVRSAGLYGLLFALLGLALAGALCGVSALAGRRWPAFPAVCGAMVSLTALAYLTVWWQLDVLSGLPLNAAERWRGALRHLGYALLAGGVVCGALLWWRYRRRRPGAAARGRMSTGRLAAAALALAALLVALGEAGLARSAPFREPADGARRPPPSGRPRQVAVVGLDGLTFRVLSPMLRAGELPTFRRLVAEGAWGSLLTYGTASSPRVWTSMATGKRVRDHGIDDFVHAGRGYRARPLKSFDRRCRALWNILSDFDRTVAVVNWLVTFPPEEVAGYVVARLDVDEENRTYPAELGGELEPLLRGPGSRRRSPRGRLLGRIDRAFAVAELLLARDRLDFLAVYSAAADSAEHRHWKSYRPQEFDPDLWQLGSPDGAGDGAGRLVPDVYRHLDRRLGGLLDALDDDALLIVVSDHGQRAAARPRVRLRLDRLLEKLGHTRLERRSPDRVDYARSRAYTLVETPWTPTLRVNVNVAGREPEGVVDPGEAPALADRIAADLRAVRFRDGTPLFGAIARGGSRRDGDVRIALARGPRLLRSAGDLRREVLVNGRAYPLAEILEIDTAISGDHDHQGVIFVRGPGVRPGPVGPRAATTAIQEIVWHLTDKIDAVDALLPLLSGLGLIERATTLDLAPTVLYALGLPVGRDMAGRPRTGLFDRPPPVEWIATYEGLELPQAAVGETPSDEEVLERLRSLGYIN